MSFPLLIELYSISEANVTTLAQMNKIPVEIAQKINEFDRQFAPQLAAIFSSRYGVLTGRLADSERKSAYEKYVGRFLANLGYAERIVKYLKKNSGKKQIIVDLAKKDWRQFLQTLVDFEKQNAEESRKNDIIMKFGDGFYWMKLNASEWSKEGQVMQHCGTPNSDTMLSLRDENGNSHVTVDLANREDEAWSNVLRAYGFSEKDIPSGFNLAIQVRGKQNKLPDRKYWPYVRDLFKKKSIVMGDFEHAQRDHEIAADFEEFVNPPGVRGVPSSEGMWGEEDG